MLSYWDSGILLLAVGVALLLPLVFDRDVRESRYLSLTYRLKYLNHLFPDEREKTGEIFSQWLHHKDRWTKLERNSIGRRMRTIRMLSGSLSGREKDSPLEAVALCGALLTDIASENWIKLWPKHAKEPLSVSDILDFVRRRLEAAPEPSPEEHGPPEREEERDARLKAWLAEQPMDLEQVVELMLSAVVILQSRIEGGARIQTG